MATSSLTLRREEELWQALAGVNDPELDESITAMGFVERASVAQDGGVEVDFRLPTYWCSPNFAFLMLDGIREALEALSWSPAWRVRLHDHMFADEVNRGIDEGRPFGAIFDELSAEADLGAVRETFARKAFMRRQEAMLLGLRARGLTDREILGMDLAAYDAACLGDDAAAQQPRYREAMLQRFPGRLPVDPAFVTWDGEAIRPEAMATYLSQLRSVRLSMEFNGTLCRGLKDVRYRELGIVDGEPTLVDFITGRQPPGDCSPQAPHD